VGCGGIGASEESRTGATAGPLKRSDAVDVKARDKEIPSRTARVATARALPPSIDGDAGGQVDYGSGKETIVLCTPCFRSAWPSALVLWRL